MKMKLIKVHKKDDRFSDSQKLLSVIEKSLNNIESAAMKIKRNMSDHYDNDDVFDIASTLFRLRDKSEDIVDVLSEVGDKLIKLAEG